MTEQVRKGSNRWLITNIAVWVFVILFLFVLGESTRTNRQAISDHSGRLVELEHDVRFLAGESRIDRAEIRSLQERVVQLEEQLNTGTAGRNAP